MIRDERDGAAGPGGQQGTTVQSSAAGSTPNTSSSDKSLPEPATPTLRPAKQQLDKHRGTYFDTSGVSNGGTEGINLIIEKVRRLAHGFRNFTHYRLRILLAA
jgi:hypothetical protein